MFLLSPRNNMEFRRIEEHLATANAIIWKSWSNLDYQSGCIKHFFFDRVHWPSLWRALSQQGISDHMVGLLQTLHKNQTVQIAEANGSSWIFDIKGGVGQGCVLSPRLFYAVLEMAMGMWRGRVGRLGLDLGDGGRTPLDLRSADDILILVTTYIDAVPLLDEFVLCFFVW